MKVTKTQLKQIIKEELTNILDEAKGDLPYSDLVRMYGGGPMKPMPPQAERPAREELKALVRSDPGAYGIWTAVLQVSRDGYKRKILWDSIIKNPLEWDLKTWSTLLRINEFINSKYPSALSRGADR